MVAIEEQLKQIETRLGALKKEEGKFKPEAEVKLTRKLTRGRATIARQIAGRREQARRFLKDIGKERVELLKAKKRGQQLFTEKLDIATKISRVKKRIASAKRGAEKAATGAVFPFGAPKAEREAFAEVAGAKRELEEFQKQLEALESEGVIPIFEGGKLIGFRGVGVPEGGRIIPPEGLGIVGIKSLARLQEKGIVEVVTEKRVEDIPPEFAASVSKKAKKDIRILDLPPRFLVKPQVIFGDPRKFGESYHKATGSTTFTIAIPIRRQAGKIFVQDFNFRFKDGKIVGMKKTGSALLTAEQYLKADIRRREKRPGFTFGDPRLARRKQMITPKEIFIARKREKFEEQKIVREALLERIEEKVSEVPAVIETRKFLEEFSRVPVETAAGVFILGKTLVTEPKEFIPTIKTIPAGIGERVKELGTFAKTDISRFSGAIAGEIAVFAGFGLLGRLGGRGVRLVGVGVKKIRGKPPKILPPVRFIGIEQIPSIGKTGRVIETRLKFEVGKLTGEARALTVSGEKAISETLSTGVLGRKAFTRKFEEVLVGKRVFAGKQVAATLEAPVRVLTEIPPLKIVREFPARIQLAIGEIATAKKRFFKEKIIPLEPPKPFGDPKTIKIIKGAEVKEFELVRLISKPVKGIDVKPFGAKSLILGEKARVIIGVTRIPKAPPQPFLGFVFRKLPKVEPEVTRIRPAPIKRTPLERTFIEPVLKPVISEAALQQAAAITTAGVQKAIKEIPQTVIRTEPLAAIRVERPAALPRVVTKPREFLDVTPRITEAISDVQALALRSGLATRAKVLQRERELLRTAEITLPKFKQPERGRLRIKLIPTIIEKLKPPKPPTITIPPIIPPLIIPIIPLPILRGKPLKKKRKKIRIPTGAELLVPGFTARALGITKEIAPKDITRELKEITRGITITPIPILKGGAK